MERRKGREQIFDEIMAPKISNLIKTINIIDPRITMKFKQDEQWQPRKKIKLLKISDIEKILKAAWDIFYRGTKIKNIAHFWLKLCKPEDNGMMSFMCWKKKLINLEFCIQWKCPSKMKTKYFLKQIKS